MFFGRYDYTIDAKGRLNFPAKFRDAMGESFVVLEWVDSCLFALPMEEVQRLADKLAELSGMDEVFFCNSGCEANEAAIKLARFYGHRQGIDNPAIRHQKARFISLPGLSGLRERGKHHSHHDRQCGACGLTHN